MSDARISAAIKSPVNPLSRRAPRKDWEAIAGDLRSLHCAQGGGRASRFDEFTETWDRYPAIT
jgi:hypothetical protein